MKKFEAVTFDYALGRQQVSEFQALLTSKTELSESKDILPFFRQRQHLSILLGALNPQIAWADRIAYEFDIFGDFACDLAVGEWSRGAYCFIEFEDALANSVFEKEGKKATRAWARRFDHGFSQIIDWLHKLDGRDGYDFESRFGRHTINYETVLVIGRDQHLDVGERSRLDWRSGSRREFETDSLHHIRSTSWLSHNSSWRSRSGFANTPDRFRINRTCYSSTDPASCTVATSSHCHSDSPVLSILTTFSEFFVAISR